MSKRLILSPLLLAIAVLACPDAPGGGASAAGERAVRSAPPAPAPAPTADPFAEILADEAGKIVKTGPTCQIVTVPLPPGVTAEELSELMNR